MKGGRELTVDWRASLTLSEDPYRSRKAMVEAIIHHFGAPEVRTHTLVWNPEHIASREAKAFVPAPHKTKTRGAFGSDERKA